MQRLQKVITSSIIISELSHIFCCGLPVLFSLVSLLSVLGVTSALPGFFIDLHDAMHVYEIPMIIFSGMMIFTGWTLHFISEKLDCHNTGCGHEPCAPKKKRSSKLLQFASILFLINVSAYFLLHGNIENLIHQPDAVHGDHNHFSD